MNLPTFDDVASAAHQIAGVAHRTPVATSRTVDARTGAQVFFKCENLQRGRRLQVPRRLQRAVAPLARPAPPRRRRLLVRQPRPGGRPRRTNPRHPARDRHADRRAGRQTRAPRPDTAPRSCSTTASAKTAKPSAARLADERGLAVIPPYNHPHIIAGAGTAALELLRRHRRARPAPRPVRRRRAASRLCARGSRPVARAAASSASSRPRATMRRDRFGRGRCRRCHNPQTVADGARTPSLGIVHVPAGAANTSPTWRRSTTRRCSARCSTCGSG